MPPIDSICNYVCTIPTLLWIEMRSPSGPGNLETESEQRCCGMNIWTVEQSRTKKKYSAA